jgi:hypothetical protein
MRPVSHGTMGSLRRENRRAGVRRTVQRNPPGMRLSRNLNILQCKTVVRAAFEGKGLFRSLSTRSEPTNCSRLPRPAGKSLVEWSWPSMESMEPYFQAGDRILTAPTSARTYDRSSPGRSRRFLFLRATSGYHPTLAVEAEAPDWRLWANNGHMDQQILLAN